MNRIKMAVVGAGVMGQLHAKTISECDSAELVAIVDLNEEVGKKIADEYGVTYISSIEKAVENEIDAYSIVLPDRLHVDAAVTVLKAGKAALVEKPLADTLEGAKRIDEAAKEGNGRYMVGHIMRFDPRYSSAAKYVQEGNVGEPVHIHAKRFSYQDVGLRMNGSSSVCFYLGVHDVDALQWISGQRIRKVYARSVSKIMPDNGVESEDAIFASLEFENGAIGNLGISWSIPDYVPSGINANLELVGTQGLLQIDTSDHGLSLMNRDAIQLPDALHWPEVNGRVYGNLREEISHFASSVRDNEKFIISEDDALQTVAVNDAILKSVQDKKEVEVERF
ncbi:Gfo/Idh/MocA family oxidoreductase [Salicibibacter cibarius]|uniref:Gfo/Idh/MocA family oxidoreductase n=1 Tax=Salicibibacter cibarius TaxID=2743000 RepID=A0A7T6Z5C3_9BACI|nr:Gfo/Idh/MocA family oxidoreductase [Salicibibacter cibarius]QQK76661.1 Gfo/Idh/MocA family oxidoreductase [Salicibibacter cibarius]